jgi:hypothetical protein
MSIVKIKRSSTSGNPGVLGAGELAYSSLVDNGSNGGDRLYIGTGTEASDGNAVNHVIIGGKRYTDLVDAANSANNANAIVKRDASGNFSAGTISASFTGNLAGNATTATALANAKTISISGDITYTSPSFDGAANVTAVGTLATVNLNTGQFGSSNAIPVITVDGKGRITAVSISAVSGGGGGGGGGNLTITDGTTTDVITVGTDTLTFFGGTGVTPEVTNNKVSFSIGQAVGTDSSPTFTGITTTGNVTVGGNLIVNGTTTTINSATLSIGDLNIVLAKDATTQAAANGAGLTVNGANATLLYNSGTDRWEFNKDLTVGTVYGTVDKANSWKTARTLSLTGDGTASLTVDGSANVSAAFTLATVNESSTGTYGTSTQVAAVTVNAKGLVTAASNTNIAIATATAAGLASFPVANFTVSSGAVSISTVDGGTY